MGETTKQKMVALKDKLRRQNDLVEELNGALQLRDLWPECFATGGCSEAIIGGPSSGYRFRITQRRGESQEWPLSDVPHEVIRNFLNRTNIDLEQDKYLARALKKIGFDR